MQHGKMVPYLFGAAAFAALLFALGVPLASLLPFAVVLACPLMMIIMMRGTAGAHDREDHTGHGCQHDPAHKDDQRRPR